MPTIENSAADLLACMVYGPIWLVVEPWIEFKEAVKGGVTSSRCISIAVVHMVVYKDDGGYGCRGTIRVQERRLWWSQLCAKIEQNLHGNLEEEIYMDQPIGFVSKGQEDKVCCLKRSIYGSSSLSECGISDSMKQLSLWT